MRTYLFSVTVSLLIALPFSSPALACKRTALAGSVDFIKAVVEEAKNVKDLSAFSIVSVERKNSRYAVKIGGSGKCIELIFSALTSPACVTTANLEERKSCL